MIPYFDAHCDTIFRCLATGEHLRRNTGHIDLVRAANYAPFAQFFALYHDAKQAPPDGMWAQCRRLYERYSLELQQNCDRIAHCTNGAEVDNAARCGKLAALLSIEGADLIECDVLKIPTVAAWGVRFFNPVWNRANPLSGTNCEDSSRGLSLQGRNFIRALEAHGIYADVSHLSDAGFWDLVHLAKRPIIASHSNSRALCPHPRNLTDDMFRAIRDTGGVVGINFYRDFVGGDSMDDLVAHIEHFLALGGETTVCLGGDLDGCEALAGKMEGLQSVKDLYAELQIRGYSRELLAKLFWQNLRNIL